MNIFYLSNDTKKCAKMHNDKHVVKMILEYAQLLSTSHHILDVDVSAVFYKPTHKNHPSALWTRDNANNYLWLYSLFCELCDEYTYRYGKVHKTDKRLRIPLSVCPKNISQNKFYQPTQAMPDEYKNKCSIVAYRYYYKNAKQHLAVWTKRDIPEFWNNDFTYKNYRTDTYMCKEQARQEACEDFMPEKYGIIEPKLYINENINGTFSMQSI